MTELYSDIPEHIKILTKFWIDLVLKQKNPIDGITIINNYTNSGLSEYQKEYVDFYFNLRMEQLNNENNYD